MISESTSTRNPEPVPIYLPGRSKPNGFVREGEFYRLFSASRHMLRPPKAERVADTNQERLDLQLGLFSGSAS